MSVSEELHEQSEHAKDPFDKRVAATSRASYGSLPVAILAATLAIVSVAGHITTTEELLLQQKASDQWSYYQAKSIRRYESEVARDVFAAMRNDAKSEEYTKNAERYRKDDEEIQKQAQDLEQRKPRKKRTPGAAPALRRSVPRNLDRIGLTRNPQQARVVLVCGHGWRRGGRNCRRHCLLRYLNQIGRSETCPTNFLRSCRF